MLHSAVRDADYAEFMSSAAVLSRIAIAYRYDHLQRDNVPEWPQPLAAVAWEYWRSLHRKPLIPIGVVIDARINT